MKRQFDWTGMPVPSRKAEVIAEAIIHEPVAGDSFLCATVFAENSREPYLQLMVWALVTEGLARENPSDRRLRARELAMATALQALDQLRELHRKGSAGVCTFLDPRGTVVREPQDTPAVSEK